MFAIVLSLVMGQAALQKPEGLSSLDARERLAAVQELAKEAPNELRGVWLYDSLLDAEPEIALASIKAWRTYEDGFISELADALTEAELDGKPLNEPAKSVDLWEKKLAGRLLDIARGPAREPAIEAVKTMAILTTFGRGLNDPILMGVLRVGDPATLKNWFVVSLRTFAEEKPQVILSLLKSCEPEEALGTILSVGFQMPAEADEAYLTYAQQGLPDWHKTAIAGFSFRPIETRRKHINTFLRSGNQGVQQTAAALCGYEDADWKKIALDRNWPGSTRALAVEYRLAQSWTDEELRRLHFDPNPLVQASVAFMRFPGLEDEPPSYDLLLQRMRSRTPELRSACLGVMARIPSLRMQALRMGYADKAPLVRQTAARWTFNGDGFEAERIQAYADGLIKSKAMFQIDSNLQANHELLAECLRSRIDRRAIVGVLELLPDRLRVAIPILIRLARSKDEDVQMEAFAGLAFVAHEGGFQAITSLASPNNPKLFAEAVYWMKENVKLQAAPFLKRFITNPNRKVRIAVKSKLAEYAKGESRGGGALALSSGGDCHNDVTRSVIEFARL